MKKHYAAAVAFLILLLSSCSGSDSADYEPVPVSPVSVDLTQVPYPKLSDYKFFTGPLKDQVPAIGVLPFQPAAVLFSDYAHKKRFVWMPAGVKASYVGDGDVLNLPVGAALIKTFYYTNVQNISPAGGTRLIETRVMIRKADGWTFNDYVWNEEQTEAFFDNSGRYTEVTFIDDNNVLRTTNYRVPSHEQCVVCHKAKEMIDGQEVTVYRPIGVKPQNLNFPISFGQASVNQLQKWIDAGYLEDNFDLPSPENTVIDYSDASKPTELRVRSYVDANCAHCHTDNRHCDYRPMRFAFADTGGPDRETMLGVCVDTEDMQDFPSNLNKIVNPGRPNQSMLYFRLNTIDEAYRMPLHGRTIIHDEGIALIEQWINSLHDCE